MKDQDKTKTQLIDELSQMRQRLAECETLKDEHKRAEEALQDSERKYRVLFESTLDGLFVIDAETMKIVIANQTAARMYGFHSVGATIVMNPLDFIHPDDRERALKIIVEDMFERDLHQMNEFRTMDKDGREIWISALGTRIEYQGKLAGLVSIRDITECKRIEQALRESEKKLSIAFYSSPNPMIIKGLADGRVIDVNDSFVHISGYGYEEIIGRKRGETRLIVKPEDRAEIREVLQQQGRVRDREVEFYMKSGEIRTGLISVETVYIGDDLCGLWVVNDITERKLAEEKIRAVQSRLRSLASRLSLAEEQERKRLAAGVHDQIGQPLAVLQMKLGTLRETLSSTGLKEQLDEIRELVGHMIQNTRSLTFELSPPILYELGLEPALEWLVEQVQAEHGIVGRFEDDGQNKTLGDDARGFVFWVVRELLMNVIKHARAQAVTVSVYRDDGQLRVVVEDNGVGFDTSEMEKRTRGFGLFSIRERLAEFGGQFEVESEPGKGTLVTLVAPLENGGESTGGN